MNIIEISIQILTNLKKNLDILKLDGENKLIQFESAFHLVDMAMDEIKLFMDKYDFESEQEEIEFFKNHMSNFLKESVYFSELFNMESIKPSGPEKEIKKFYEKELISINEFLQNNQNLYNYLLMKKENQDRVFFLRSAQAPVYKPNLFWHTLDTRYCTVYTLYFARIMGTLALADYIHDQLRILKVYDNPYDSEKKRQLYWSGKKADLVELVYALKTSSAVNNGSASIAELATSIGELFGKELNDYYRTFLEIRSRKKSRTVFLDQCRENLEAYMDEFEEKE
ncbi:RteC protein [Algoriphagus ratkowskyi]|uniref:RteC protein n=1 Tax=Algoriphagus ratkowskyi TaxID=57028 RepID=A0A2W7RSV1_9BACT|nr:RteC domain-containing protein [Algoriphagus ratkowskyi]PZX57609.1 RteC protein [Algoriphagus ratkowskyi]TXD78883.1 hypothetical protein ESW18_05020 [Algoriphagus ratkowskyi]